MVVPPSQARVPVQWGALGISHSGASVSPTEAAFKLWRGSPWVVLESLLTPGWLFLGWEKKNPTNPCLIQAHAAWCSLAGVRGGMWSPDICHSLWIYGSDLKDAASCKQEECAKGKI